MVKDYRKEVSMRTVEIKPYTELKQNFITCAFLSLKTTEQLRIQNINLENIKT